MTTSSPRFSSHLNPNWYKDLPDRDAQPSPADPDPAIGEDLNFIDEEMMEVSRSSSVMRGAFLFFGLIGLLVMVWVGNIMIRALSSPLVSDWLAILAMLILVGGITIVLRAIELDFRMPRDMPIRFNRRTREIIVYDYPLSLNPFARRRADIRRFSWDDVQAEISKMAGYNGKAYLVRYSLVLVICAPGTGNVIERVNLKGNEVSDAALPGIWAYIRSYMADGLANLPVAIVRRREISFRRSLFAYMPYFDPSKEGSEIRARMGGLEWSLALVLIWFFWLLLPIGAFNYIALRCAPEPKWPTLVNEECHRGK